MKHALVIVMFSGLALCSGCWPELEIVWSPDGQVGVLTGGAALLFCDAQGRILPATVPGGSRAAFAGDSRTLFVAVMQSVSTWDEAKKLLTPQQQAQVTLEARLLAERLKSTPRDQWEKRDERELEQAGKPGYFLTVLLCLRDEHWTDLDKLLTDEDRKGAREMKVPYHRIATASIQGGQLSPLKDLCQGFGDVASLRAHPKGLGVAVVAGQYLRVVLQTREVIEIANPTANYPDWTPDGQSLCYVAGQDPFNAQERSQLGTLRMRRIFDAAGRRITPPPTQAASRPSPVRELAGVLFHPTARVRCLNDGRILFSGVKTTLPCPPDDMQPGLFAIDPARGPGITEVLPAGTLKRLDGFLLDLMELSPDQARIALPTEKGRIAVVALASGEVQILQDQDIAEPILRPTWRTNDELTYLAPPPAGQEQRHIVIRQLAEAKTRALSEGWSKEVLGRWADIQEKKQDKK